MPRKIFAGNNHWGSYGFSGCECQGCQLGSICNCDPHKNSFAGMGDDGEDYSSDDSGASSDSSSGGDASDYTDSGDTYASTDDSAAADDGSGDYTASSSDESDYAVTDNSSDYLDASSNDDLSVTEEQEADYEDDQGYTGEDYLSTDYDAEVEDPSITQDEKDSVDEENFNAVQKGSAAAAKSGDSSAVSSFLQKAVAPLAQNQAQALLSKLAAGAVSPTLKTAIAQLTGQTLGNPAVPAGSTVRLVPKNKASGLTTTAKIGLAAGVLALLGVAVILAKKKKSKVPVPQGA